MRLCRPPLPGCHRRVYRLQYYFRIRRSSGQLMKGYIFLIPFVPREQGRIQTSPQAEESISFFLLIPNNPHIVQSVARFSDSIVRNGISPHKPRAPDISCSCPHHSVIDRNCLSYVSLRWILRLAHGSVSLLAGLVPEPTCQVEEKEEDHQCVPRPGDAAAHAGPAPVLCRGRHGEQPVLLPRQRLSLGHGNAGGVSAAAPAGPRPSAGHATVAVTVQPRPGPAAQLHGSLQRPLVQRLRFTVPPLPVAFPRNVGLTLRPHERIGLPAAV